MPQVDIKQIVTNPLPERKWIIPRLVPEGSVIVLAGDPGIGKTCLCYGACLALSCGCRFLNMPLQMRRVLYFDEENSSEDSAAYLWHLWRGMKLPPEAMDKMAANMRLEHFSLGYENETPIPYMREIARIHQPELIVIDTLTICCRIEDENSNAEMCRALRALRSVRGVAPPTCGMLLLHHTKAGHRAGQRDIRGAKGLKGWTDGVVIHRTVQGAGKRADGLQVTQLSFLKMRTFGSHETLRIDPAWTSNRGLVFNLVKVE